MAQLTCFHSRVQRGKRKEFDDGALLCKLFQAQPYLKLKPCRHHPGTSKRLHSCRAGQSMSARACPAQTKIQRLDSVCLCLWRVPCLMGARLRACSTIGMSPGGTGRRSNATGAGQAGAELRRPHTMQLLRQMVCVCDEKTAHAVLECTNL